MGTQQERDRRHLRKAIAALTTCKDHLRALGPTRELLPEAMAADLLEDLWKLLEKAQEPAAAAARRSRTPRK